MRKETICCNSCGEEIKEIEDFFSVAPGKKKKVGVTISLTAGGRNRIHLDNNVQMRVSVDTYVIGEDGSNQCGQVDLHWSCLTYLIKNRLAKWYRVTWDEDEEFRNG